MKDTVIGAVGPAHVERVDVEPGVDHDGDSSIWVNIYYRPEADNIPPTVLAELTSEVRSRLWEQGEERFPYIRHRLPDLAASRA